MAQNFPYTAHTSSPKFFTLDHTNTGDEAIPDGLPQSPESLQKIAEDIAANAAGLIRTQRQEKTRHASSTSASFPSMSQTTMLGLIDASMAVAKTKSSEVDPVTEIDQNSEDYVHQQLKQHCPDSAVLGEESGGKIADSGLTWIVDPIDGTVNFVYGIPSFSVSIAATFNGFPVAGAVADVAHGLVFSVCLGQAATVTDIVFDAAGGVASINEQGRQRLGRDNQNTDLETALVATGFSYGAEQRAAQAQLLTTVLPKVRDIRRIGSAALDLCMLAAGQIDGYYEHGLSAWDYAAGALVAARAGATVYIPHFDRISAERLPAIGGSAGVHAELRKLLEEAGAGGELPLG